MATEKRIRAQQREVQEQLIAAVEDLSKQILAMSRKLDKMASSSLGKMAGTKE